MKNLIYIFVKGQIWWRHCLLNIVSDNCFTSAVVCCCTHTWKTIDRQAQMLKIHINHYQVMGLSSIFRAYNICLLWQAVKTSQVMWPWEGVQRQEKCPNLEGHFFFISLCHENFYMLYYFVIFYTRNQRIKLKISSIPLHANSMYYYYTTRARLCTNEAWLSYRGL